MTAPLPAGTWTVDPVHSRVVFGVEHAGIATFQGHFSDVSGALTDGVLTGSATVASIEVPTAEMKGHLLSEDFFDAEAHPEIGFEATSLERHGERLAARGELTLRGVTMPLLAEGTIAGPATYLDGLERIAIALQTTIDRRVFGVAWNAVLPSGGKAVGDDVTITASLQLVG